MPIPAQSYTAWKTGITVLHCIAISTSFLRVWQRRRSNGMWWDDWTAIPATIMSGINVAVVWLLFIETQPDEYATRKAILYYVLGFSFFSLIWLTRISLALGIARIFPAWGTPRRYALGLALCFAIIWVGVLTWLTTTGCVDDKTGPGQHTGKAFFNCDLDRYSLTVTNLVADVIADILLIASPFYMLWRVRLPTNQRRLVLTLFSASILTLASVILFAGLTFSPLMQGPGAPIVQAMVAQIESALSLIVCNLLVVVTFFYKNFHKDGNDPEVIGSQVGNHPEPVVGRSRNPVNVTVITLTEIAQDDKFERTETDWSPHETYMNLKGKSSDENIA
ncbi:hypothetical protein BDQ12DRAFT_76913 [Crucibulum laeve]|uniref:Rhodopsin domain-containing protein n=1 Tax=Crucibulum laeve TaxID=68775 RepID=A0A5C3M4M8_9AGAR|nr:hypothetical protein BDQ12DRAFT_76913 [Crucibulum laeve]